MKGFSVDHHKWGRLSCGAVSILMMRVSQVVALLLYALGLSGGQVLFKLAAINLPNGTASAKIAYLLCSPAFVCAMSLYLGLSLFWVWVLSFTPISRAYPFVTISIVITPVIGAWLFGERLSLTYAGGIVLIALGVIMVARSA